MRSLIGSLILLLLPILSVTPGLAQWTTSGSTDEMTGEKNSYAHSPRTAATKPMGFPYRGTKAWLGFGCDGDSEWAYVGFTGAPNLVDSETKDGYDIFSTRVRWDDVVETMSFRQDWGASFIHFSSGRAAITKMAAASTVLLELKWYGESRTYFQLTGSFVPSSTVSVAVKEPLSTHVKSGLRMVSSENVHSGRVSWELSSRRRFPPRQDRL